MKHAAIAQLHPDVQTFADLWILWWVHGETGLRAVTRGPQAESLLTPLGATNIHCTSLPTDARHYKTNLNECIKQKKTCHSTFN